MLGKKVIVIALMAVVFLSSSVDRSMIADGRHRRKPHTASESSIALVVPAKVQASITGLKTLIAGTAKGIDPSGRIAGFRVVKHRRGSEIAGGAKMIDPSGRGG